MKNKILHIVLIILSALALTSCAVLGDTEATATAPEATPTASAQVVATPSESLAMPSESSAPGNTDAGEAFTYSAEYVANENIKVTMQRNLGDSSFSKITYVNVKRGGIDDDAYIVTQFDEMQPIYYTDFFADEDGMWSHFSDSTSDNIKFILPEKLSVGMEFVSAGDESVVLEIGAECEYGGYSAKDCVIISSASVAYSQVVYHVYEKGVGEIARYMKYDADVIDMIFVAESVEEMSEADVKAFIDGL